MRHIDKSIVAQFAKDIGWEEKEKAHLAELKTRSPKERSEYFNAHRDWNEFQPLMQKFGYKCWYSEAKIGAGDFEIDHFRPKNRSRQFDGSVLKENGYWWLAYNWENFRISGRMMNIRRRDRLVDCSEVEGKGDFFPLHFDVHAKIAEDCSVISCEFPILLDPFSEYDVDLISFDENGETIPNTSDDLEILRACKSIEFYHLNLDQLNYQRKLIWDECLEEIDDAKKCYFEAVSLFQKKDVLEKCFKMLRELCDKNSEFSAVAITCIKLYSKLDGYKDILDRFKY